MNENTHVSLRDLSEVFEIIIRHIEELHGSTIELDADYFWSIPPAELYDNYAQPTDLTLGQLSESLDNLRSIVAEPDRAISYALVWLGDILRAAGHKLVG